MEFSMIDTAADGLKAGLMGVRDIAVIVVPLMVVIELAKDSGVMQWITGRFRPLAALLKISRESLLPLVVGLMVGLAFGSGVIINAARDGQLSKKDRHVVVVYLSLCHSVFEDTLLLAAVGASLSWLVGSRLLLATAAAMLLARIFPHQDMEAQSQPLGMG
ncbi:MAG: nucleoside recognition protein [Firmicutes bacterium]|jgi:spore maturation protein SpmB|nr:nucleoside recognition protein [Bacillota bacterium]